MKQRAFTLVELIVAIAIIITMSAILLPNYQSVRKQFSLLHDIYALAQNLRMAQEMATATQELPDGSVPDGYGIYLVNNGQLYVLYADKDGNEAYTGVSENVKTIDLENSYVKGISPSPLSINFKGPDPRTKITNDLSSILITLALKEDPIQEKKVRVYKSGLMYVE